MRKYHNALVNHVVSDDPLSLCFIAPLIVDFDYEKVTNLIAPSKFQHAILNAKRMHELNLQSPLLLNGKFFRLAIEFSMPSCGIVPEIIDPTSLAVFNLNPAHFDKSTVWQLSPDLIAKLIRLFELKHVIILTLASLRAPGSAASGTALPGTKKVWQGLERLNRDAIEEKRERMGKQTETSVEP